MSLLFETEVRYAVLLSTNISAKTEDYLHFWLCGTFVISGS